MYRCAISERELAIDMQQHRARLAIQNSLTRFVCGALMLGALAIGTAHADDASSATEVSAASMSSSVTSSSVLMADKLLVVKSERRLYALRHGQVLRSFRVALGLSPQGHKQREGDYKTPEGQYKLIRRNPRSGFFLSMEISYPNSADINRAQRQGVRPGGAIMLHGWPNTPRKTSDYYRTADWTDGCIAVTNADMVDIWLMTPIETPIEIVP
jgi:murein L,D-transpeptidase YafK